MIDKTQGTTRRRYTLHDAGGWYRALPHDFVFVFGSNQRGVHGSGAAVAARFYFGAELGVGEGFRGQSYGIPTKDHEMRIRSIDDIRGAVKRFLDFAKQYPRKIFVITEIGTGRAKYDPSEISKLFWDVPPNCMLPAAWKEYLPEDAHFIVSKLNSTWRHGDPHPNTPVRKPNDYRPPHTRIQEHH